MAELAKRPRHVVAGLVLTAALGAFALFSFFRTYDPMLLVMAAVLALMLWTVLLIHGLLTRGLGGAGADGGRPPPSP